MMVGEEDEGEEGEQTDQTRWQKSRSIRSNSATQMRDRGVYAN